MRIETGLTYSVLSPALLLAVVVSTACAAAPEPATTRSPRPAGEATEIPGYVIGVGDILNIAVWKEPDLEATTAVRPDGRISVALLGEQTAAGLTVEELRQRLSEGYSRFVTAPIVSVVVEAIHSWTVFISGEVNSPGTYELQQRTRLMQALAMAGGLSPYAKQKVIVLRNEGGRERRIELDVKAIVSGRNPAQNIVLEPGDTIIVL